MTEFSLLSAFMIGIAGGVHCFGMCGGIALAMRSASPPNSPHLPYAITYHLGRIISYTIAGAFTGGIGSIISSASVYGARMLQIVSIVMLVLMALYIGQWYRGLVKVEAIGAKLWAHLRPLSSRFIPFKTPLHALPYGIIWGWLPCGLVYSTLTWSLACDSVTQGASIMLAFGLGTYPTMLAASLTADKIKTVYQHVITRQIIAGLLIAYAGTLLFQRFV